MSQASPPTEKQWTDVDRTGLPEIHSLREERLQIFWALSVAKRSGAFQSLSASVISDMLRDYCGIAIARQKVASILKSETKGVASSGKAKPPRYMIMKQGEDELLGSGLQPLFIDPARALTSIRAVEDLFAAVQGVIRVCDTYVDSRTLDFLSRAGAATSIKLLTENIQDGGRFGRDCLAFAKEHSASLEVRVSAPGKFHDRYLLHDEGMYLFGSSLKDIGKKQSIVVGLSRDFGREMTHAFERLWATAAKP